MRSRFTTSLLVFSVVAALAAPACRREEIAFDAGASAVDAAPAASVAAIAPVPVGPEWQILASELPAALLSVGGRNSTDIYTVGADKGKGPLVYHFDGKGWKSLSTGSSGDLWWVQAISGGPVLMVGANSTILRYDGTRFEAIKAPVAKQTIYGVWGTSGDDFYAVGNDHGTAGFVWHFRKGAFVREPLPKDLPRTLAHNDPGFYKVWGTGEDVWVVGAAGTVLRRHGTSPFEVVPSGTRDTLFTIHGTNDHRIAVGGASEGVIVEAKGGGNFARSSAPGSGVLQGIFAGAGSVGDWTSGERGFVFHRAAGERDFAMVDHGLVLPPSSSLHAIFVDDAGGVWSVGGNVLSSAMDGGMMIYGGAHVSPVILEE